MTGNYLIRKYEPGDYDAIAHLWQVTGLGGPERGDDKETIERSITLGGIMLIVEMEHSGRIAGTSWMTFDGRRIHLHHFGIDPEIQGRGVGRSLLTESLKMVKKLGYQVKIEVHDKNERALSLYLKNGFIPLGDYHVYMIREPEKINRDHQ